MQSRFPQALRSTRSVLARVPTETFGTTTTVVGGSIEITSRAAPPQLCKHATTVRPIARLRLRARCLFAEASRGRGTKKHGKRLVRQRLRKAVRGKSGGTPHGSQIVVVQPCGAADKRPGETIRARLELILADVSIGADGCRFKAAQGGSGNA